MSQRKYTMDMLKETDVLGGKIAKTPLEEGYKVLREGEVEENQLFEDAKLYRRMVGKLIDLKLARKSCRFGLGFQRTKSAPCIVSASEGASEIGSTNGLR